MKLVSKTDIDAAPEALFAALCDRDWFEGLARRGGVQVDRLDAGGPFAVGSGWSLQFAYRGRVRTVTSRIVSMTVPRLIGLSGQSGGFETEAEVLFVPLGRGTTRMTVALDLKPRSFTARLILQTLKIGKGRLKDRLDHRVQAMGAALKDRAVQRERH